MLPILSHSIGKRDERVHWSSFEVLDRHRRQLMNKKKKFTPFCWTSFDGLFGRIRFCLDHRRGKIYLLMKQAEARRLYGALSVFSLASTRFYQRKVKKS